MNFCGETRPLYLETDASGVGFGAGLLQITNRINCPWDEATHKTDWFCQQKPSSCGKEIYQHREALGIQCGLGRFYHCCFSRGVSIITDHKALVTISKKDVTTL